MISSTRIAACVGLLGLLGACATFGTNVAGDFSCRAPKGDCAPSRVIDARATAAISGDQPNSELLRPRVGVATDDTTRTNERTLRIVFPAHVDETGTLHDEAVAWAVVETPRWAAELRRRPGDDAAPPMMRQLKRQLREAPRAAPEQSPPATEADVTPPELLETSPFSLSDLPPSLTSRDASPLVLPSTAREAVAGAKAPAVEGFDMFPPRHDRTPRPFLGSKPLVFPSAAAIDAAKPKPAPSVGTPTEDQEGK